MIEYDNWKSAPMPIALDKKIKETAELGTSQLFYKYRDVSKNTERMISHRELWFAHPKSFNDPFEFKSSIKRMSREAFFNYSADNGVAQEHIEGFWKQYETVTDEEYKKYIEKIDKDLNETSRVFSMSLVSDSILMWSYYAQSHQGLCFGFDIAKDFETFNMPFRVEYPDSQERPMIANLDNKNEVGNWNQHYTKAKCWEHEQEIRIYKFGENTNIYCYKHESLKEIIFGCSMCDQNIDHFSSLIRNKKGFEHVKLKKAEIDGNLFKLRLVDI